MISAFYLQGIDKNIPLNLLIDSRWSLICKQFVTTQKLRSFELTAPIEIKLPNNNNMKIYSHHLTIRSS